jgi:peptidyl-prolyl cis-trans isomerase C
MHNTAKRLAWIATMFLTALFVTAADKPQSKPNTGTAKTNLANLFPDKVIAKGKGLEIKRSDLDDAFVQFKATRAANGQLIPEARRVEVERGLLEQLIFTRVLTNKATVADRAKAKDNADKFVADSRKKFPSEETFVRQLKALGMSQEQFQMRAMDDAVAEAVLDRELKAKVVISDADVKKYYDEHPQDFEQPEMVRAAHVLLGTKDPATNQEFSDEQKKEKKATAEKVLARARKGEDFASLVKEYSDDSGSKERGGEYTFPRGRMVPEFEAAAFSLNTNQISDIVTTQFGFHIIKVNEKIPARKLDFTKVSEDVREGMVREQLSKQLPDYLDKVKLDAKVEVLDPSLVRPPPSRSAAALPGDKPPPAKPEPANPAKK